MLATKDERQAQVAGWVFLVVNYLVRSWLWVVVALAALVLLPAQQDLELGYPALAVSLLPPVALGLVVVSLVAAFMSTVSTAVNWGASYLTHDLYQRFCRPQAGQKELLLVGQLTTVLLLLLGVVTALISDSIGTVFRLVIAIGTGPGVVLVLRWFWWRVNAAAELAAMLSGFLVGFSTSVVPLLRIDDYGVRLMVTTGLSALIWLGVLLVTPPESPEVLERFVQQVNPPGPGWKRWRQRLGIQPLEGLDRLLRRFLLSTGLLFGGLLATGGFLLHQQRAVGSVWRLQFSVFSPYGVTGDSRQPRLGPRMVERLISLCLFSLQAVAGRHLVGVLPRPVCCECAHLAAGRHGRSGSHWLSHGPEQAICLLICLFLRGNCSRRRL